MTFWLIVFAVLMTVIVVAVARKERRKREAFLRHSEIPKYDQHLRF